jgi:hypothetical protein
MSKLTKSPVAFRAPLQSPFKTPTKLSGTSFRLSDSDEIIGAMQRLSSPTNSSTSVKLTAAAPTSPLARALLAKVGHHSQTDSVNHGASKETSSIHHTDQLLRVLWEDSSHGAVARENASPTYKLGLNPTSLLPVKPADDPVIEVCFVLVTRYGDIK